MKKLQFVLFAAILLSIASCKKGESGSYGSYSLKGISYNVVSCQGEYNSIVATPPGDNSSLFIEFNNNSFVLPATGGTYTAIGYLNSTPGMQVVISVFTKSDGITYVATSGNTTNQLVNVKVNSGKLSLTGAGIQMQNENAPLDTAVLNFNLTQQ